MALIPRSGALLLSRALDHVGVFARTVEDAALLAETLAGFDEEDPDTRPMARPPLRRGGGERAAIAAALRLRALAGLAACRAGDSGSVRGAGRRARRGGERGRARAELRARRRAAWHRHGGRDGPQPPSRLREGRRQAEPGAAPAHRARPRLPCHRLHARRGRYRPAQRGARRRSSTSTTPSSRPPRPARRRAASTARATRHSAPRGPISARPP